MVRNQYNEQLAELKSLLTEMGDLNSQAIAQVVAALKSPAIPPRKEGELYGSVSVVRAIKRYENAVDEKESEIERLCLKLIIRQQPVASDLLFITSAMKMITDMERIADQAVDISELVVKMSGLKEGEIPEEMSAMADAVQKMVVGVMQAFTERSEQKAREICRADDVVDECFIKIKTKLTSVMHRSGDEGGNERALDLLMVAKYLERIGDHAVNIAEWVLFSLTGEHKKLG
ncbi:phosphate signaling complex protein PhoU [Candidatus Borkfalkia ceftriaxoniphila]|jgi:phosphate transport system regulatory protein phoU|uniref:Phosphate-specific transport system accessory protein PhoU n=1 Tax=Candidatus Borkfalkia ceftriaxoniphila TaxID=2508949 RepID=A0A4Q2KEP0_9FIRM|nr:phosphate signaling complex protein PhoU [Candidatus Borkfalkia ceftriaxoniphila]RXZ61661.1 phosphate signaling complex protein PhoU [Candidatus Borkfalkia ceftriaxoniphila]